jgi:hypothetical protein
MIAVQAVCWFRRLVLKIEHGHPHCCNPAFGDNHRFTSLSIPDIYAERRLAVVDMAS